MNREWDGDLRLPEGLTFAQMQDNNQTNVYTSRKEKKTSLAAAKQKEDQMQR